MPPGFVPKELRMTCAHFLSRPRLGTTFLTLRRFFLRQRAPTVWGVTGRTPLEGSRLTLEASTRHLTDQRETGTSAARDFRCSADDCLTSVGVMVPVLAAAVRFSGWLGWSLALALTSTAIGAPVINEIWYRPGSGYPETPALEFIEIHNPDTTTANLAGWKLTDGPDFTFPAGTSIPPGGFLVVAANPTALQAAAPISSPVVGPWKAGDRVSNQGETITLVNGAAVIVDSVDYADEGDWATRTRDSLGGWSWVTPANGSGRSLERRNPKLPFTNGQNWGASNAVGGSPGAANSLLTANVAPIISHVKHAPAVPTSADPVTISARVSDESMASNVAVTLYWRNATTTSPGAFQAAVMSHLDGGTFTTGLAPLPDKSVVEFYISANDGTNTRTWPAATNEGQNANAAYQVDNDVPAGNAPVYRLILTATENAAFNTYIASGTAPGPGPGGPGGPGGNIGDRRFNLTLVASRGENTTVRYRTSMRVRGNSSRNYTLKPLRISMPNDDRWDGISDFLLNPRGSPVQFLAHRILRAAGLVAADTTPVKLRRQGLDASVNSGSAADYGYYVRVEEINSDYLERHWPGAVDGQIYRKTAVSSWAYSATAPTTPEGAWSGWSKESNHARNDWSDVMNFSKVWQDTAAPYFTGASAGNVAAGTWNGTPFSDADVTTLGNVADLDYLARWLAVMTVLPNNEPNLSTGEDDDYAAAFINDGTRTRMILVPHDLDTTFGLGEETVSATAIGLYDATEVDTVPRAGIGPVTLMKPLLPLLGDSTRPGNAAFRARYLLAIRELFGSVLDADTAGNPEPTFHRFVENHLGDWTPDSYRTQIKTFMTERQIHLLGLIGAPKVAASAPTSTATLAAAVTPTLRINEVLATNTRINYSGTFPDLIELHNAGAAEIDVSGMSLSDDPELPRKYVFPSGTRLAAGEYRIILADTTTSGSGLRTGFSLDAEGDRVRLYDAPARGGVLLDSIRFGFQIADTSISRTGSDNATWALTSPTLGLANGAALPTGTPEALRINEWAGHITWRLDHDLVELYNPGTQPVALTGVRLTDDVATRPTRFTFPNLSFIAPGGFLALFGADFDFGLNGDFDFVFLVGENGAPIDQVDLASQPAEQSAARVPDGSNIWKTLTTPTPGISNATPLPASYVQLMAQLRITEVMYAPSGGGDFEFIELRNIGATSLDLSGVRFTNGLDYTFANGTSLAPGAYLVVAKSRSTFLSRYPSASGVLAPGSFSGALDNAGENIALTLPAPWYVHIVRFAYLDSWHPLASGNGHSLTVRSPATVPVRDLGDRTAWRPSAAVNGSPGSADSSSVSITAAQAASVSTPSGQSTTLAVRVSAPSPATYQWQKLNNGTWVNIGGATTASYTIVSTQSFDAGTYRVLVTVDGETLASDATTVTVTASTAPSTTRLVNLSTRALSLTDANAVVPGFVISGSGSKRLLIRAIGPTLTGFGVPGALVDPNLTLKRYNTTRQAYEDVTTNDNWSSAANATSLANVTAEFGGFPLTPGSADAAILVELAPGQYTAVTGAANNGTGVALVELYDTDTAPTTRLANIATRAFVSTGDNIMAAGFVISGAGTKTLLIRAVGPTLGGFGVSGALLDPQLTIFRGTESILSNDDWGVSLSSATSASVAAQVGAFALPANSKDAGFVVTLPDGNYTVHVTGVSSTSGVALVEVYEVQ